jgi:hypothetical protein
MAMPEGAKLSLVERYTRNWVKENITLDYVKEFPMIAEMLSTVVKTDNKLKMSRVVPLQCVYDIFEVTADTVGNVLKQLNIKKEDFLNTLINKDELFSLVAFKGRLSDRIVSLFTLQVIEYDENNRVVFVNEVTSTSELAGYMIPVVILNYLTDVYKSFYQESKNLIMTANVFFFEKFDN